MQRKKQLYIIFVNDRPHQSEKVGFAVHICQMISIFVGPLET